MLEQKEVERFCFAKEAYKVTPFQIRTFWNHVLKGRIPSYKIGKHRLFRKSEVIAAIEKCRVSTAAELLS
jgi:excisionase family DNA binding protein